MTFLEIRKFPDPLLRLKAKAIQQIDNSTHDLIDNMLETMRAAPGVGLAAPQIGESLRLVVVEYADEEKEDEKPKTYILVNPEIITTSREVVTDVEACLSVPGLAGEVERFESITIKARNRFGKPTKIHAKGWLARIFQHEIDHLNGILYTDRATNIFEPTQEQLDLIKD